PAGKPPRRTRAPKTRTRGVPRSRRGAKRVIPVLFLLLVVAALWFGYRVFQPGHGDGDAQRPVVVTIAQGATAGEIADELKSQGVIDSSFFFNIRSRVSGRRADLKAGRFTLRRDMSYTAALDALTQNPAAAPTLTVTLPEGRSIGEAATLVHRAGLTGSYRKSATRNPRAVKGFKAYGVPKGTRSLEGFLFPATYELKRGSRTATASALVAQQLATFRGTYDKLDRRAAKRKNLSDYDVLIIASMIEREAQVAKDRPLISAVIYNRLRQHIPLGIDATLRYHLNNWTRPLRQSELQKDSAFNTRTRQGLPPTPIGSPGLASIKAALNPAKVSYLYYVVKPGGHGAHAFSSTDAQFQRDVAAYNRARAANGGKDPSG
ncbi:MAG: mltG, partial [Conexibacter sp.]|nr:mltG [Conexibacter sp.]